MPPRYSIAVDNELLSAVTSQEAATVTPRMSQIFLSLLGMISDDPDNSLPVAQEWLFRFDGGGDSNSSPWRQLQEVVNEADEQESRHALDWMSTRGIVDLREEGSSLYLTIRNVMSVSVGENQAQVGLEN